MGHLKSLQATVTLVCGPDRATLPGASGSLSGVNESSEQFAQMGHLKSLHAGVTLVYGPLRAASPAASGSWSSMNALSGKFVCSYDSGAQNAQGNTSSSSRQLVLVVGFCIQLERWWVDHSGLHLQQQQAACRGWIGHLQHLHTRVMWFFWRGLFSTYDHGANYVVLLERSCLNVRSWQQLCGSFGEVLPHCKIVVPIMCFFWKKSCLNLRSWCQPRGSFGKSPAST
ncbi:hypothetical protein DUNSADRAFT_5305 [Dunaliella salina]|uniref:Encoded protein n=1 Tax=Dunaliella salina TaxID=3046 RepID=A0ABQ7GQI2_DUNSA|nr:hypothetical protein DUNSADRAFT_5305 [Dunaliella salina]|eukprot:KAF5836866.1 hypothetical protein DUNSADRAFT_5305 [Dunaliella salina]